MFYFNSNLNFAHTETELPTHTSHFACACGVLVVSVCEIFTFWFLLKLTDTHDKWPAHLQTSKTIFDRELVLRTEISFITKNLSINLRIKIFPFKPFVLKNNFAHTEPYTHQPHTPHQHPNLCVVLVRVVSVCMKIWFLFYKSLWCLWVCGGEKEGSVWRLCPMSNSTLSELSKF